MARKSNPGSILDLPESITSVAPTSARILAGILPEFQEALSTLTEELMSVREGDGALALARAFVALHRIKELTNNIHGKDGGILNGLTDIYKSEYLPKKFEEAGIGGSIPLAEGYRVGISGKCQVSLKKENRPEGFKWLRANNLGDLIEETVNAMTLSATATTLLEETGMEFPADIFSVNNKMSTSVTKIAKK